VAKTVLIAGDPGATRNALCFLLANRGYDVVQASDGREAVEQIRRRHPDLAILEAELSERSGYGVYRLLQEDPETRDIPVLLLVADTAAFSMPTRTLPPVEQLVSIPFTAHDLLQRVGRLLP
jgi:CheY-like chemotaxis protein